MAMFKKLPLILTFFTLFNHSIFAQEIKSPEEIFGFKMGEDRKLINWNQIVSYFQMLDNQSKKIKVIEIGRTTQDRQMIMAIISSEETIEELGKYKDEESNNCVEMKEYGEIGK